MAAVDLLPRFVKTYLSYFSSEAMVIPSSYYHILPRILPKTSILQGQGGCLWEVPMKKKHNQVFFGKGWDKFVQENSLKDGELLSFVYDGDHTFEVSIYGLSGCKEIRAVLEVEDLTSLTSGDTEPEMVNTIPKTRNKGKSKEKATVDSDEESDNEAFLSLDLAENSDSNGSYSPPSGVNMVTCAAPTSSR